MSNPKIWGQIRKVIGRPITITGFVIGFCIPVYFALQLFGLVRGGIEYFGYFGYLVILAIWFSSAFGLIFFGLIISGDK